MSKVFRNSFNGGIQNFQLYYRYDYPKSLVSLLHCDNLVPRVIGSLEPRVSTDAVLESIDGMTNGDVSAFKSAQSDLFNMNDVKVIKFAPVKSNGRTDVLFIGDTETVLVFRMLADESIACALTKIDGLESFIPSRNTVVLNDTCIYTCISGVGQITRLRDEFKCERYDANLPITHEMEGTPEVANTMYGITKVENIEVQEREYSTQMGNIKRNGYLVPLFGGFGNKQQETETTTLAQIGFIECNHKDEPVTESVVEDFTTYAPAVVQLSDYYQSFKSKMRDFTILSGEPIKMPGTTQYGLNEDGLIGSHMLFDVLSGRAFNTYRDIKAYNNGISDVYEHIVTFKKDNLGHYAKAVLLDHFVVVPKDEVLFSGVLKTYNHLVDIKKISENRTKVLMVGCETTNWKHFYGLSRRRDPNWEGGPVITEAQLSGTGRSTYGDYTNFNGDAKSCGSSFREYLRMPRIVFNHIWKKSEVSTMIDTFGWASVPYGDYRTKALFDEDTTDAQEIKCLKEYYAVMEYMAIIYASDTQDPTISLSSAYNGHTGYISNIANGVIDIGDGGTKTWSVQDNASLKTIYTLDSLWGSWKVISQGRWNGSVYIKQKDKLTGYITIIESHTSNEYDINFIFEDENYNSDIEYIVEIDITAAPTGTPSVRFDIEWDSQKKMNITSPNKGAGLWYRTHKFGVSSMRGYTAICFEQQRLWLSRGTEIYVSEAGNFKQFREFNTQTKSSPMKLLIADTQTSEIQWLVPTSNSILCGTTSALWAILPGNGVYSHEGIVARKQSNVSSSSIPAITIGSEVVSVSADRKAIFASVYDYTLEGYHSVELSLLSSDIFEASRYGRIRNITYDNIGHKLYILTENGTVVLNYNKSEKIIAFSTMSFQKHDGSNNPIRTITVLDNSRCLYMTDYEKLAMDSVYINNSYNITDVCLDFKTPEYMIHNGSKIDVSVPIKRSFETFPINFASNIFNNTHGKQIRVSDITMYQKGSGISKIDTGDGEETFGGVMVADGDIVNNNEVNVYDINVSSGWELMPTIKVTSDSKQRVVYNALQYKFN